MLQTDVLTAYYTYGLLTTIETSKTDMYIVAS